MSPQYVPAPEGELGNPGLEPGPVRFGVALVAELGEPSEEPDEGIEAPPLDRIGLQIYEPDFGMGRLELVDQPALPDARLSSYRNSPRAVPDRGGEFVFEEGEFFIPPDEGAGEERSAVGNNARGEDGGLDLDWKPFTRSRTDPERRSPLDSGKDGPERTVPGSAR